MSKLKLPIHSLKRKGVDIYIYIYTILDSSIDTSNPKEHFKNFNKKFLYIIYQSILNGKLRRKFSDTFFFFDEKNF